jgi:outer membrane protein TolC
VRTASWLSAGVCRLGLFLGSASGAAASVVPPALPVDPEITEPVPAEASKAAVPLPPSPTVPTISLAEAVAMALAGNYQILGSVDALQTARLNERASRAQFYPKITPIFRRSTTVTDTSVPSDPQYSTIHTYSLEATQRVPWLGGTLGATGSLNTRPVNDSLGERAAELRLNFTQPLLRGFGPTASFAELTASRRARESQERAYQLARQSLAIDVVSAFYEVAKQRQLLAVAGQSLERNETLLRASQARMEAGLASKLDVYRAELQLSFAQDAKVTSETSLQTALENFRVLLGRHPTDGLEPEDEPLDDSFTFTLDPLPTLVERALLNRVELVESRAQVDDARRAASIARQNLLPRLDVTLGVNRTGYGATFRDSLNAGDNRFDVSLSTSYPIERAGDRTQKAVAEIAVVAGERALAQRRLEIEAEVRGSVRNIDRISKSVELQKKGVDLALQQHRLATLRYQRGIASNFDVVEAEDHLVSARAALVGLLADYHVARIRLLKATGSLDVEKEFLQ